MTIVRAKQTLRKHVNLAWSELVASITALSADCEVKPAAAAGIFSIDMDDDESIRMVVNPVAFRLKETAKAGKAEMFVTVRGKVNFSVDGDRNIPLACHFSTSVGYFRLHKGKLDHTLGIRYDYDNHRPAHPVFHAQLVSHAKDLAIVNGNFPTTFEIGEDLMTGVPDKVRLPTAHMDPLAVFVQLLADHFLNAGSSTAAFATFEKARSALMFFKSDPRRSARLEDVNIAQCFRGPRWYPPP